MILMAGLSILFFVLNPKLNRGVKTEMVKPPLTRSTENISELNSLGKACREKKDRATSESPSTLEDKGPGRIPDTTVFPQDLSSKTDYFSSIFCAL